MFKNLLTRLTKRTCLIACAVLAGQSTTNAQFSFNEGDHICLIGNSLAERMQHHGWLETLLQSQLPNKNLVFRNQSSPFVPKYLQNMPLG